MGQKELLIVERFADNGGFSHYCVICKETGKLLYSQAESEEVQKTDTTRKIESLQKEKEALRIGYNEVMEDSHKENTKLKERVKEFEDFIITGETKTIIYLSDGTVRLPKNYEGIEG